MPAACRNMPETCPYVLDWVGAKLSRTRRAPAEMGLSGRGEAQGQPLPSGQ